MRVQVRQMYAAHPRVVAASATCRQSVSASRRQWPGESADARDRCTPGRIWRRFLPARTVTFARRALVAAMIHQIDREADRPSRSQ